MSESREIPTRRLRQNADANGQKAETEFRDGLLSLMPLVGSVSRSMCRDADLAEDILQEALCKAWGARSTFCPGSNLKAWLLTILRNTYYQYCRRAWRLLPLNEDVALNIPGPENEQQWSVDLADTVEALRVLSLVQRETLMLVGVGGLKYDEAAAIGNCAIGTAKSRVTRARKKILAAMEGSVKPNSVRQIPVGHATQELLRELESYMSRTGRG